jgi:hypothetical protein
MAVKAYPRELAPFAVWASHDPGSGATLPGLVDAYLEALGAGEVPGRRLTQVARTALRRFVKFAQGG